MQSGARKRARLAAVVSILAVPAALLVLLFGGGRVRGCLALSGCDPTMAPGPFPFIGTTEGAVAATALLGVAWLGATVTAFVAWWLGVAQVAWTIRERPSTGDADAEPMIDA